MFELNEAFHMSGDTNFYVCTKLGKDILINGRDMPPELNSKQPPLAHEFYF